jgi:hypothetical protein
MDDMVKAAMAKWPTVPACFAWLGLDARGDWYLRDANAQSAGDFQTACGSAQPHAAKGSRLMHVGLGAFIGRNSGPDAEGRWYFQNGPQRVFVELALTPWVWRLDASGRVQSHTGLDAQTVHRCLLDECGRVYLHTDLGLGLVHSQDVPEVAENAEKGLWVPEPVAAGDLPRLYGYIVSPATHVSVAQKNHPA